MQRHSAIGFERENTPTWARAGRAAAPKSGGYLSGQAVAGGISRENLGGPLAKQRTANATEWRSPPWRLRFAVESEVGIAVRSHLGHIQAFDFNFLADADGRDQVAELEPDVGHHETKDDNGGSIE
jgi:hypothetical protein